MIRTDNTGVVTALQDDGLVEVRLDAGKGHLSLPSEILESITEVHQDGPRKVAVPAASDRASQPAGTQDDAPDTGADDTPDIRLAFDPQLDNEANPVAYETWLLNSSTCKIIYELRVLTQGYQRWSKSGQLAAGSKKRLDAIEYRWLNEKLSCELDVRAVKVGGTGPRNFRKMSLKAARFFQLLQDVPELYRDAHLLEVFPRLQTTNSAPAAAPPKGSLRALTAEAIRQRPKKDNSKKRVSTDLAEKMDFAESIDLHLPALVEDPESVPRHEVLRLQLKAFDDYIDKALKLGVDSVFIIHGVGSGALKRAIHSRLHRTPFVRKFTNEYHPKYGYGATEVVFD